MDNSRCAILVPAGRSIEPHCALTLGQLEARGYPVRRLYGFAQVDMARNRLATDALAEGFEELMWIDSDIAFEPQSVDRLRSHGLPVACGLYPKKGERALSSQLLPGTDRLVFGQGGGLVEIRYAAAGFLYTRREVYLEIQRREQLPMCNRRIGQPTLPFFLPMVVPDGDDHRYLGEDFSFCERLRRCGFRIVADTTIRLQHIGIYGYSWEDLGGSLPRSASYELSFRREPGPPEHDTQGRTP
jgi:hypothetical protein